MIVPKYCLTISGYSRSAESMSRKMTPELLQVLAQRVVDDLGLVLRADAGQELALGLGDAQLLEGVLDVGRDLVPVLALLLARLDVVEDVVEVDAGQVAAPVGQRPLVEVLERLQAVLEHPLRFALHRRDFATMSALRPRFDLKT